MASVQPSEIPAYQQPFSQVLTALGADARRGLSDGEARVRLGRHGKNELTADTPVPAWRKCLAQFQDVLVVLLLIYTPFLQQAFSTTSLSPVDWLRCGIVASSVLWLCELGKAVIRVRE